MSLFRTRCADPYETVAVHDSFLNHWSMRSAGENVWMEITRRNGIGADLKAPSAARGGMATASDVLLPVSDNRTSCRYVEVPGG
jgi:hypothetical protein